MIGIVVLLTVIAGLMWRVWLHREKAGRADDERTVVRLTLPENFASSSLRA